ncbi:MAG: hypothetical protein HY319_01570 [Armatimonadetes bacterium]|nr:hypothetical protein [Armatimonadota bacterium]
MGSGIRHGTGDGLGEGQQLEPAGRRRPTALLRDRRPAAGTVCPQRTLKDAGYLLADYAVSESTGASFPGVSTSTLSLRTLLRPTARLTLGGTYVRYDASTPQVSENYSLQLGYVLNEHSELALGYRFSPFQVDLLGPDPVINPGHIYTLELRQSWGGP